MNRRILWLGVGSIAAVAACAFFVMGQFGMDANQPIVGDDLDALVEMNPQVHLPVDENLRNVYVGDDRITPMRSVAEELDGETTVYTYWPSGKLKEAITYFAPETADSELKVRRRAQFKPDGYTYLSDIEFYRSGNLRKQMAYDEGARVATVRQYFDDRDYKLELFERYVPEKNIAFIWKKTNSTRYYATGVIMEEFQTAENYAYTKRFFDAAGKLLREQVMKEWKSEYTDTTFQNDHVTPRKVVWQNYRGTNVKFFTTAGKLYLQRGWYGSIESGMMYVRYFDAFENMVLEQTFDLYQESEGAPQRYVPFGIYVKQAGDTRLSLQYFYESDGVLQSFTDYGNPPYKVGRRTIYTNDKQGNLISIEVYSAPKELVSKSEFSSAEGKKIADFVEIKPEWLKMEPYELPEVVIPYQPPGPGGY